MAAFKHVSKLFMKVDKMNQSSRSFFCARHRNGRSRHAQRLIILIFFLCIGPRRSGAAATAAAARHRATAAAVSLLPLPPVFPLLHDRDLPLQTPDAITLIAHNGAGLAQQVAATLGTLAEMENNLMGNFIEV